MPLRLNIGLSKKVGLPDYGSLGASVNLELELDSGAIGDPDRLQQQIRHLFGLAEKSVEEKLSGRQPNSHADNGHGREIPHNGSGNGHSRSDHSSGNGQNGQTSRHSSNGRAATNSQVRAIRAITSRQGVDLDQLLSSRYSIRYPEDLTLADASALIDELKAQPAASGGTR